MGGRGKKKGLATRLLHPDRHADDGFVSFASPTWRGSTVLFGTMAEVEQPAPDQYRYGLQGTPTARELALKIAEVEGADEVVLAPSGLAAVTLAMLAFCRAGSHLLIPESIYGPSATFARRMLKRYGVEVVTYDPMIGGDIARLIRPTSALVWCESPGSISMEVQDVPAICAAAKAHGVPVAIDNSYGAGVLFDAFAAGVDVSVQALTKYQAGHSDLLMGSVATRGAEAGKKVRRAAHELGLNVSPDDCSLVLRGLKTFDLRLRHVGDAAFKIASWLAGREEITHVLHPAFPDCPGNDIWKRDWSGSAGLFSVIFGKWKREQVVRFVDALELFGIGYSWGGAHSVVMSYYDLDRPSAELGPLLVRFNIGLENVDDLVADLEQALQAAA